MKKHTILKTFSCPTRQQLYNILLLFAVGIFISSLVSCKKEVDNKNGNGNGNGNGTIPDDTSPFWRDDYRQHHLNGRVKTVKTFNVYDDSVQEDEYNILEYDANGNLKKKWHVINSEYYGNHHSGITLFHDAQNRLTKVLYGHEENPEVEVAEFGYDGSHTAYIPTNIFSMEDLRLQKGVSSVKYWIGGVLTLEAKVTSVSGNRITFEGKAGGYFASMLGKMDKIEIECVGNYPAFIKFMEGSKVIADASVTFGSDGIPTKVVYGAASTSVTTEYTSVAGFLLMTKQIDSSRPGNYEEYKYNSKGYLETKRTFEEGTPSVEAHYSYEYDEKGNWIKKSVHYGNVSERELSKIREYTYW